MIVVDASVLANALADDGPAGEASRTALDLHPDERAAPEHVDLETLSVLRRRWLAGFIDDARLERAFNDLVRFRLKRRPILPLMSRAYELRHNLTPYDAAYVALAEALGYTLVTADGRLSRSPGIRCRVEVVADRG